MRKIIILLFILLVVPASYTIASTGRAIFAGGCFWCMEAPFEKLDGVSEVISGYTGGAMLNPTYQEVSAGGTGHTEAVEIHYDPQLVSYEKLLEVFWRQITVGPSIVAVFSI